LAVSSIADFSLGGFKEVIDDEVEKPEEVTKIALCTGKVYYDLIEEKRKLGNKEHIAIIRLEQIYPLPLVQLNKLFEKYSNAKDIIWVQEEPWNMGAWPFIRSELDKLDLHIIARPATGSPATGSSKFHNMQQTKIIEKLFDECGECPRVGTDCKMACIGNNWRAVAEEIALKSK
jgi:2-oxoglutarate dehydrogenase E1 component